MERTLSQTVLTDALGYYVPTLGLDKAEGPCPNYPACRHAAGYCRHPRYWYLDGTSTQLGRGWPRWHSLDQARHDLEASGYTVSDAPINLSGSYGVTHVATARALADTQERQRTEWSGAEPCYLRLGGLPAGGRSRNHADGTLECGVSVFRGLLRADGEVRPALSDHTLIDWHMLSERPLYIVEGREAGIGADGEPVLCNARIVRRVR